MMNHETYRDSDVAYMLVHSNPKLKRSFDTTSEFAFESSEKVILPSLRMQIRMIPQKSCNFFQSHLVEQWDIDNYFHCVNHCSLCNYCKPVPEGEGVGVYPSLKQ